MYRSKLASSLQARLNYSIVGQSEPIEQIVTKFEMFFGGLNYEKRPLGSFFMLGPTGVGKTETVRAISKYFYAVPDHFIKIDCAEYQHSHEIAKLQGSPPGYLGHRETQPLLSQSNINGFKTDAAPFTIILFDEVEKAHDSLWMLLLGILDKANMRTGDNLMVDFQKTFIFMTSNLGAREALKIACGDYIGFGKRLISEELTAQTSASISSTTHEAAKRRFSPEFMGRLDSVVTFNALSKEDLLLVLQKEINKISVIIHSHRGLGVAFDLSDSAKEFLLDKRTDKNHGARGIRRSIETFILNPVAGMLSDGLIEDNMILSIDVDSSGKELILVPRLAMFAQ